MPAPTRTARRRVVPTTLIQPPGAPEIASYALSELGRDGQWAHTGHASVDDAGCDATGCIIGGCAFTGATAGCEVKG